MEPWIASRFGVFIPDLSQEGRVAACGWLLQLHAMTLPDAAASCYGPGLEVGVRLVAATVPKKTCTPQTRLLDDYYFNILNETLSLLPANSQLSCSVS